MSEKRFSGWAVLFIVALVLAVSGLAVLGGTFLGFKLGQASVNWPWSAGLRAPYFQRMPHFYGPPYFHHTPHPYGMPDRFDLPQPDDRPERDQSPEQPGTAQPYLGVLFEPVTPAMAEQRELPVDHGALIVQVIDDGPAQQAGLRVGDVVVAVEGRRITADRTLADLILAYAPGDEVELAVRRATRSLSIQVELGVRPTGVPSGRIRER